MDLEPVRDAPGVVARADRHRRAGPQPDQPDRQARRAAARDRHRRICRPADLRGRRRHAAQRARAPPALAQDHLRRPAGRHGHRRGARAGRQSGHRGHDPASAATPRPRSPPRRAGFRAACGVGGQDHFYLEGQIALAVPGEDGDVKVWSSTQHPSETQHMIAHVLGVPNHTVTGGSAPHGRRLRRQGNPGQPVRLRRRPRGAEAPDAPPSSALDRDDDMAITGKRHDFVIDYDGRLRRRGPHPRRADDGRRRAAAISADLSGPVTDRALFHADNCYFYPRRPRSTRVPLKTNTVSNTAFRGFGGPQGMIGAERIIDEVAFAVGIDPLECRKRNFYGTTGPQRHALSPDGRGQHRRPSSSASSRRSRDYAARDGARSARPTPTSRIIKRGIALTPVKFGISFTATHYNQAGALVHIYNDGSRPSEPRRHRDGAGAVHQGGAGGGRGIPARSRPHQGHWRPRPARCPNTSATAASSGADLNGMAAQAAARTLKERLVDFAADALERAGGPGRVPAEPGAGRQPGGRRSGRTDQAGLYGPRVAVGDRLLQDAEDPLGPRRRAAATRSIYFAYGAACSEVAVDTLTGEYRIERVDILHDVGRSLHPADRHRPDRRRLRAGRGLADHRGTGVGRQGPAVHPCALHLQDPGLRRPPARSSTCTLMEGVENREDDDLHAPRPWASRPSCSASRCCMRCPTPSPASPTTRCSRLSTRRPRRSAC